jgi:hypothetical protein
MSAIRATRAAAMAKPATGMVAAGDRVHVKTRMPERCTLRIVLDDRQATAVKADQPAFGVQLQDFSR